MKEKSFKLKVAVALIVLILIIIILLLLNRKVYTITFDSCGGTLVEAVSVGKNDRIPEPKAPTKEGYVFDGWYYNNERYDFKKNVTSNMILEARWIVWVEVSGVRLNYEELNIGLGETIQLIATIEPENARNTEVLWSSSNLDVVSVDSEGNITALGEGTSIVKVITKDGGFIAEVKVVVSCNSTKATEDIENNDTENNEKTIKVKGVSLNKTTLTLNVGETSTLIAKVQPSNATNKNVTWVSSNPNIVSVDLNGNIKTLKPGTVTITVTTQEGKYTARITITVKEKSVSEPENNNPESNIPTDIKVTGVTLNKTTLTLTEGETSKLIATLNPSNATNKNVTWVSSNPNVVSVDANGNIKSLKTGTATITVITQDGNYKANCQVQVNEKTASYSVIFTPYSQDATGAVMQYNVSVMKNNKEFSDYDKIIYNGAKVGTYLSSKQYNSNISNATIWLKDGSKVTATVIYK